MAFRTTAFEAAQARGWNIEELERRSGVPASTLYQIRNGTRRVGPRTMRGLMQAFADLPFEKLFVPTDLAIAPDESANVGTEAAA